MCFESSPTHEALMLNALDVDLDEDARLPIPPRREPT
jgi:hypothetical protein